MACPSAVFLVLRAAAADALVPEVLHGVLDQGLDAVGLVGPHAEHGEDAVHGHIHAHVAHLALGRGVEGLRIELGLLVGLLALLRVPH